MDVFCGNFWEFFVEYLFTMDLFSLEDDDGNDLFITQSSNSSNGNNSNSVIGDGSDFSSPCVSLVSKNAAPQYEDISDDDFEIPCSQAVLQEDR